jgi:thiamine biosynthesis protein ThiI
MKIIVGSAETSLKSSSVEKKFTRRLQDRIEEKLTGLGIQADQTWEEGRLFVEVDEDDAADAADTLTRLPGISTVAPCLQTGLDADEIWETVQEAIENEEPDSFAVDVRRVGEGHSYTSHELENDIGQRIVDEHGWDVDLDDPDLTVHIEARYDNAYVYTRRLEGVGGVPVNRDATVVVPLRDRIDVLAGFFLMRRGCSVVPVYAGREPEEVTEAMTILTEYDPQATLVTVRDDDYTEAINQTAEAMDAGAIGLGLTADEIECFSDDGYERTVLTPTCSLAEEEALERYADISVPRF